MYIKNASGIYMPGVEEDFDKVAEGNIKWNTLSISINICLKDSTRCKSGTSKQTNLISTSRNRWKYNLYIKCTLDCNLITSVWPEIRITVTNMKMCIVCKFKSSLAKSNLYIVSFPVELLPIIKKRCPIKSPLFYYFLTLEY